MIRLIFSRKRQIGSFLIRVFTGSRWSHVGILTPWGTVIDATLKHGVAETSLDKHLEGISEHRLVEYVDADPLGVVTAARTQIGKKYDWLAIVAFYFRARWDSEDSWFCSEFVAWAINMGWRRIFDTKEASRITPQDLLKIDLSQFGRQ